MNQLDLHLEHVVLVRGDEVCFVFLDGGGLKLFNFLNDVVDAKVGV